MPTTTRAASRRLVLQWCDVYRDGGSYGAVLQDGDRRVALFLQVRGWDHPDEPRDYEDLCVTEGSEPTEGGTVIDTSGGMWLRAFERADTSGADSRARNRWAEMLELMGKP